MGRRWSWIGFIGLAVVTVALVVAAFMRSPVVPTTTATPLPTQTGVSPLPTTTQGGDSRRGGLVLVGDQYAQGRWVDQVGADLGVTVANLSESGMGYRSSPRSCDHEPCTPFRGLASTVAGLDPQFVVLVGGDADGDNDISMQVRATLADFRMAMPDTVIVTMPPLSARTPRPHWLTMHTNQVKEASAEVGVLWVNAVAIARDPDSYDGTALTPEAGAELAEALVSALRVG